MKTTKDMNDFKEPGDNKKKSRKKSKHNKLHNDFSIDLPIQPEIPLKDLEDTKILKNIIDKQLQHYETKKKRLETENDVKALCAQISEYLDCFAIVGYDINKNRVIIKKTKTHQDEDSLIESMKYMFYRMTQEE